MSFSEFLFTFSKAAVRKDYLSTHAFLKKSAIWSAAEISNYQEKAIATIVNTAYDTIPYYKKTWDERRIDPRQVKDMGNLGMLPILTKYEINQDLDAMMNLAATAKKIPSSSGGSTGVPLRYYLSPVNALYSSLLLDRGLGLGGYHGGDRLAIVAGGSLVGARKSMRKRFIERLANIRYFSSYGMSDEILEQYADEIIKFQPKFIRGYASALNALASHMEATGKHKKVHIHAIFSTAEMLVDNVRGNIESVFGCKVFDGWGLNDSGATAFECTQHHGMHVDPERAFVEIVEDETTEAYGPGVGRVVVTNLVDTLMPFIRYDSGDLGRMETSKCECGLSTPRIFIDYGRITDQIKVGGKTVGAPVLTVLMGALPVVQYQIAKTAANRLTFRIIRAKNYSDDTEMFLRRSIRERIGDIDIIFDYVDEIFPPNGKKHKFLINEFDV